MQSLAVSYIDTFAIASSGARGGGGRSPDSLPKRITSVALLIPRKLVINTVGDKRRFGRMAKLAGVEGIVVPRTFESTEEAMRSLVGVANSSSSSLVFIKPSASSGGRGVEPVATKELAKYLEARGGLKRGELIQEGVDDLALHEGKKFVIRSFFIVYGGALYVSHHAMAIVHGLPFETSSASREIHVDHHHPGRISDNLKAVLGDDDSAKWITAIIKAATLAGPMFERVVAESAKDNLRYHVFGVDVLPKASGAAMLVECNIMPSADKTDPQDLMAVSVLRLLFGVVKGDGEVDDEMTKVWTAPLFRL
jgi:hypothetical protein